MKKHLFFFFTALITLNSFGQGFSNSTINWSAPNGGKLLGAINYGFPSTAGTATSLDNISSQTWDLVDLNGDDKLDLVIFAQLDGTVVSCFSPGLNSYWKVYLNTGNGFSSTHTQWDIPNGGKSANSNIYGFNARSGVAQTGEVVGSQSWSLLDMDGDNRPDLVVTAQLQNGGKVTSFTPGSNPYWIVYKNSGTGFLPPVNWNLPNGGKRINLDAYGFDNLSGIALTSDGTGSQTWATTDMNNDGKPDLVVTAQLQGANVTNFSPTSGPYWMVYINNGTGFNTTATNWNVPVGGRFTGATNYGFVNTYGFAASNDNSGSQNWGMTDMDGDHKPDLVVAAQIQAGKLSTFGIGTGPYWKVYTNNGAGFNTSAINWTLPDGGKAISNTLTLGYNALAGTAISTDYTGSQSWGLVDFDNDGRPDLVVTAQLQGGNVTSFSPGLGQYWKVYPNKGANFDTSPINWGMPSGGRITGGLVYGFDYTSGVAAPSHNANSQSWTIIDLDGDHWVDLLVTAQFIDAKVSSFQPSSGQYWKLYRGDGILGIDQLEANELKNIRVYPNPNNGNFIIKGEVKETLTVSNQLGQKIRTVELTRENNFTENISDLKTGIYFLHTKTGCAKVAVTN